MINKANTEVEYTKKQERLIKALCFFVVIILPLSIGFINLIAFLIVGAKHPDSRVADNFYKSALAVYKNNDAQEKARLLGVSAQATLSLQDKQLSLRLEGDHGNPMALVIRFIHPTNSAQDLTVIVNKNPADKAHYSGVMAADINNFSELRAKPVNRDDALWELVLLNADKGLGDYIQANNLVWQASF